jgi:catalase
MTGVPAMIVDRQLALFDQVHPDYGAGVRAVLKGRATTPKAAAE